jgi:hypothetical protein
MADVLVVGHIYMCSIITGLVDVGRLGRVEIFGRGESERREGGKEEEGEEEGGRLYWLSSHNI